MIKNQENNLQIITYNVHFPHDIVRDMTGILYLSLTKAKNVIRTCLFLLFSSCKIKTSGWVTLPQPYIWNDHPSPRWKKLKNPCLITLAPADVTLTPLQTCTLSHYILLHYITLHYITLHYITLHYITLHYITLHYINYITLHYITLITLHYITLHYITLHYITMNICLYIHVTWRYNTIPYNTIHPKSHHTTRT